MARSITLVRLPSIDDPFVTVDAALAPGIPLTTAAAATPAAAAWYDLPDNCQYG